MNKFCCRKGFLVVTKDELDEMANVGFCDLKRLPSGDYSVYLGERGCPCLNDFKCLIHKSPNRPKVCGKFPIFIEGDTVRVSGRCLAVREGLLYPYIAKLKSLGYKIYEGDSTWEIFNTK